jgi:hypothetical protein
LAAFDRRLKRYKPVRKQGLPGRLFAGAGVRHFASAADAVTNVAIEIMQNTRAIGGNLPLKRARRAFINRPYNANRRPPRRRRGKSRHPSRVSLPAFLAPERSARDTRINPIACIRSHCA